MAHAALARWVRADARVSFVPRVASAPRSLRLAAARSSEASSTSSPASEDAPARGGRRGQRGRGSTRALTTKSRGGGGGAKGRGGRGRGDEGRAGGGRARVVRNPRARGPPVTAPEAVARALALAARLREDDPEVLADARSIGRALADCKDARDAEASDAAWSLYEASAESGARDGFHVREFNFALGAVSAGPAGPARVRAVWDALISARSTNRTGAKPNAVTLALIARGVCRGAADVPEALALVREGVSAGGNVDAYVLNALLHFCLRDAAEAARRGERASEECSSRRINNSDSDSDSDSDSENTPRDDDAGGKECGLLAVAARDGALAVWSAGRGMHDERTLTSTIKTLADAGDAGAARRVFDEAVSAGTPIDADCLAVMLRIIGAGIDPRAGSRSSEGGAKTRGDPPASSAAARLFRELAVGTSSRARRVKATTACANAALAACSRDGNFDDALDIWRGMLSAAAGSRGASTTEREDAASSSLPYPAPDKASLASVILACGRAGRGDLALAAFEEGKAVPGVECDAVTVNVMLDACAKASDGTLSSASALDVLMDAVERRVPVDACTVASLLHAYCASDQIPAKDALEQAYAIVELGKFLKVAPTPAVTNALLRACVAAGELERASKTFEAAAFPSDPAGGFEPTNDAASPAAVDEVSVAILVEGFSSAGDLRGARAIAALAWDLAPEISAEATATLLVRACVHAGDADAARRAYDEATRVRRVAPTLGLVKALLAGLARRGSWREAIRLVSDDVATGPEGGVVADAELVELFAAALERGGEVEQAEQARTMGLWLTDSDDALVQYLLKEDERGERLL